MDEKRKKVFVGMSGGVDSSVAALLLKKRGYDVAGAFIRGYNVDGCADRDAEDARRVAEHLGIPFYVFDMEREYKESVVDYMVSAYRDGVTPNPDVMCNKEIKFGLFLEKALAAGADFVATGHYVRLRRNSLSRTGRSFAPAAKAALRSQPQNPPHRRNPAFAASESFSQENSGSLGLFEAKDKNKDQSYFLWTLTERQLGHCLFPIGDYTKPQVREIARKAKLPTAEKKDSQGICFLGQVDLEDFLKQYLPEKPGEILTTDGEVVGRHEGIYFYTIGQRHLGVDLKVKNPDHEPYYVAEKNLKSNTLIVAEGEDNPALFKREMELRQVNFIGGEPCALPVLARVRYRQQLAAARLEKQDSKDVPFDKLRVRLIFDQPQKFVAPGQSAVFYSKNGELLGGGVII